MPDRDIGDFATVVNPQETWVLELQEAGGGASRKTTIAALRKAAFGSRGRASSAGVLQSGGFGFSSIEVISPGIFDWTLIAPVPSTSTAFVLATANLTGGGAVASARLTSRKTVRVEINIAGSPFSASHSLMVAGL
jgi:hypothetical protein